MKLGKLKFAMSAFALAICLNPNVGWSTRAYGALITGVITAQPQSDAIEIANHVYHVKANSAAAKAMRGFSIGQNVDAALDGPASSTASEVVAITLHAGS